MLRQITPVFRNVANISRISGNKKAVDSNDYLLCSL